jgi:ATP-dependent helicase/nuclease subunit A
MSRTEPPRPLPDQAARDAIAADLGTTILVEAAAGTGKTESLVQRMVALVRTGAAPVERISAVTFTIKAAAELSQRFQTRLEQAARDAGPEERPRLEQALARLDAAFIGTIHAFCARLLRERPVEAGVDPGFAEMDQPEDTVARQEAWDRYTERLFSEDSPILARLSALGVKLEDLRQTFEALSENEDVEPALEGQTPPPDFSAARSAVADYLERAAREVPDVPPPDGWTEYQEAVRRALRLSAFVTESEPASFVRVAEVLERTEDDAKDAGRLRGQFEALVRDVLAPAIRAWREYLHPILIAIVEPAVRDYAAWRRRNGRLNFQDLLLHARGLLRRNPAVRRAFQERFLPILVDEFQDTDPIQAEILLYLTGSDTEGTDWRKLTPRPGSLFVVGDPKQSIYRFRRADIETYGLVRSRIEKSGRLLALTTNFRATGRLCDWVNTVFRAEFPAEASREQAAYAALEAHREPGGPPVFRLETRTATSTSEPVVEQDSRRIARAIEAAVGTGQRRPGDFLVLFRKRLHMAAYARELEARGLPYELAGGGAFEDSEELKALLSLLAAISDPDDPVPFVAALRGPLFGIDDQALYRHFAAGGRFSFRAVLPVTADPRIARACELMAEGEAFAAGIPPGAAIARICETLGWVAAAEARELGDSRAGNLLKALAAARTLSAEGLDFPAVVRELTRMTHAGYIEEMSVEPGRRDAVRLLTVHGAKGLEAPVVFLADPRTDRPKAPRSWIDRAGSTARGHWLVIRETDGFGVIEIARPAEWEAMAEREKRFEEAEKKRLLYVAATRAREMLVVSTWRQGKGKPKGPWSPFDPYIHDDLPEPAPPVAAQAPPPLRDLPAEAAAFRERRKARSAASSRVSYTVSPVTHVAHTGPRPAWERTGRGMSWGRVVHRLLEALMRDGRLDVRVYAANLLAEEERSVGDIEEIVRTVEAVRASDLWMRASAAPRRLVEVPFALMVRREELGLADGPAETLLQGAIDLVFEESGTWTLVDYKSDTVGENLDGIVAFYTPQIAIYRRYWERLTGRPTRAGLFFAETGREVWPKLP